MFAVIFEVQPKPERWDAYLELAERLKPALATVDGFIDNERFMSLRTAGRLLSLSIWRDEKSVVRWRTNALHHAGQEKGRREIFADYHLRVGEVSADSAAREPLGQQRLDATEIGAAKAVTISEVPARDGTPLADLPAALALPSGSPDLIDHAVFDSIATPGKRLLLANWCSESAAEAWRPQAPGLRHRRVRVVRDYGLRDRREAPQYYPEVGQSA